MLAGDGPDDPRHQLRGSTRGRGREPLAEHPREIARLIDAQGEDDQVGRPLALLPWSTSADEHLLAIAADNARKRSVCARELR